MRYSCAGILILYLIIIFANLTFCEETSTITSEESIPVNLQKYNNNTLKKLNEKPVSYPSLYQSFLSYSLKVIFFLIILIGIVYFIKKFYRKKIVPAYLDEVVKVIGSKIIAHNKYIQLIQFGNRFILIGITNDNIIKLSEIINKEEIDKIKLDLNLENKETDFANLLKMQTGIKTEDSLKKFKNQLKDLLKKKER